jgi:hypothetical protein
MRLPESSTCFFKLSLPSYTNAASLKAKLLYAMYNVPNMDGDRSLSAEAMARYQEI